MTGMFLNPHVESRQCLRILLFCLAVCASMRAAPDDHQLDTITVEAKRKLEHQVDQFVQAAIVHRVGEPLMRWDTPVCPLVAGLSKEHGEFVLQRLSVAAKNAGAPLAPEKCAANFFVLVTSKADQILMELKKKRPGLFNTSHGVGGLEHFMATERPVRVWYNSDQSGDPAPGLAVIATFIGNGSSAVGGRETGGVTGSVSSSVSAGTLRMPNSRLTLTTAKEHQQCHHRHLTRPK